MKKISDKTKKQLIHLYTQTNTSVVIISSVLDISIKSIYRILDEYTIERRPKKEYDLTLAVEMYKEGAYLSDIYRESNIDCLTLYKELDKQNIPRRKEIHSRNRTQSHTISENEDSIIEYYMENKSLTEIAKTLMISYPVVKKVITNALETGTIQEREIDTNKKKQHEQIQKIAQLYVELETNAKIRDVAKAFCVNESNLYYAVAKLKK